MEIERKWMVTGWPENLTCDREYAMDQGYISVRPTVRIRREALMGGNVENILCIKGRGGLAREEIELQVSPEEFARLEALIGVPLIRKTRRNFPLPDGHTLEVNHVDVGLPGEFWYAEVEFATEAEALAWQPGELAAYLAEEVTGQPGQSMGEYWLETRGQTV